MTFSLYRDEIKEVIHLFKYVGKDHLVEWLAPMMVDSLSQRKESFDCVVPVPMPYWRKIKRGYNQAELLAQRIATDLAIPVETKWLKRRSFGLTQIGLTRTKRMKNAARSYGVRKRAAESRGKRVLLVDDVLTTGATLKRCAFLLKSCGAASVSAAVLARD